MFFSVRKLESMAPRMRMEKCAQVVLFFVKELESGKKINSAYLLQLFRIISGTLPESEKTRFDKLAAALPENPGKGDCRALEDIRYFLLGAAGREPAEWDLKLVSPDRTGRNTRKVLPINVYLDGLRSPFNLGSIFRTAESFCYENIYLSESVPDPMHPRALRSSMGTVEKVKWTRAGLESIHGPVFALETGGTNIDDFEFPMNGTVIVGSEESGISRKAAGKAAESLGFVSIPLFGEKGSINAGVAFGILSCSWIRYINNREKGVNLS